MKHIRKAKEHRLEYNASSKSVSFLLCAPLRSVASNSWLHRGCFKRARSCCFCSRVVGYSRRKWRLETSFYMNLLGCSAEGSFHFSVLKSLVSYEPTFKRNGNSKFRLRNLVFSMGSPQAAEILLNSYCSAQHVGFLNFLTDPCIPLRSSQTTFWRNLSLPVNSSEHLNASCCLCCSHKPNF